jgi:hypothetical protein
MTHGDDEPVIRDWGIPELLFAGTSRSVRVMRRQIGHRPLLLALIRADLT